MKNKNILILVGLIILIIAGCGVYFFLNKDNDILNKNNNASSIKMELNTDDGDLKIDWEKYETKEISLSSSLTINEGGIYVLSGTLNNGYIRINTVEDVKLVFNNVSITNNFGPAIYVEKAENTLIYLNEDTNNTLTDGRVYSGFESKVDGVIYSKDDLIFDGKGTLNITGNKKNGIVSKNDLKIIDGNYNITSTNVAVSGKDSVYIVNGNFKLVTGGDALKSTNNTDEGKGFIKISDGVFNIESKMDGIQAETKMLIENGTFDVKAGVGKTSKSDLESYKGIKANDDLLIEDGSFEIHSIDVCIKSKMNLGINNGTFNLISKDDGIHSNGEVIINNGNYVIDSENDAIKGAIVTVNDGDYKLKSLDDGISVAGGNDEELGKSESSSFNKVSSNTLNINGGNIYINATGDGIDINGSGYINGGFITIDGPITDGDGALDYDNELIINKGTLIASGSSGMAQGFSKSSVQYSVEVFFDNAISENAKVKLLDSKNREVISYVSSKSYSSLVISCEELKKGKYTLKVDGESDRTFEIKDINTIVGKVRRAPHGGHGDPKDKDIPKRR